MEEITRLGGADVSIDTAAAPEPIGQAYRSLARGGTLVFVGLPAKNETPIPIFETVLSGIDMKGSIVGTHQDLVDVSDLHRLGRTVVHKERRVLERVNDAFEEVLEGSAASPRLVFEVDGSVRA